MKNKFFLATTPVFLVVQAACYWTIKFFQTDYHTFDFWIDSAIPFVPAFVYVYNLFYPFTLVCFYLIYKADREKYIRTFISGIISVLVCYAVYLAYPTVMVRPDAASLGGITGRFLAFTYSMDDPAVNCCPSIHCLFAFLVMGAGFFSDKIKKSLKVVFFTGSLLIVLSTFFIKQHYVLDAVTALAAYLAAWFAVGRFRRK
ncbi:MAG: phosphatase PAP2 family protein [Spirochaetales bacterium]|nr:phosphatase PAP2 family protein [Spirochaetales bacterium]